MKKTVLITGASGYLGRELIGQLLERGDAIVASTSDPAKLMETFCNNKALKCVTREELFSDGNHWDDVETVFHLAFARRFRPNSEIADSVQYSRRVFEKVKERRIPRLINVSSQSVYGNTEGDRDENMTVSPEMVYAMAKYATEIVMESVFQNCTTTVTTSIRLDPIAQNQNLLPRLVEQAFEKHEISLVGGGQIFSLLDIRDGAAAFLKLLDTPTEKWKPVYNVGWNNTIYTLTELADLVKQVAEVHGSGEIKITLKSEDIRTYAGLNSACFIADTGWQPRYGIEDIIDRCVNEYLNKSRSREK